MREREKYCYRRKRGYEERIEEEAMMSQHERKARIGRAIIVGWDRMKHRQDDLIRLHHGTAATRLLRCVGVFSLIDLEWNEQ
jgi:hypothetical protein